MSRPTEETIAEISLPEPLLVPVSEAARRLSVSEYLIRRLVRKDVLVAKKISKTKWLVTTASIRKFAGAV